MAFAILLASAVPLLAQSPAPATAPPTAADGEQQPRSLALATPSTQPSRVAELERQVQDLQQTLAEKEQKAPFFWLALGFVGQFIFGLRFVVQWIATERQKKSVIPLAFWYLSLAGTIVLLAYSIWRLDPVFIAGFSLNMVIYLRNLYFIHIHPRKQAAAVQQDKSDPAVGNRDATGS